MKKSVKASLTLAEAKFYARAALYAYKTRDELDKLERQYKETPSSCILNKFYDEIDPKVRQPIPVANNDIEFYYVEYKNEIIFMIPGTRKRPDAFLMDFNTDFNMDMIRTEIFGGHNVQVHRGFMERYKLLRKEILKIVEIHGSSKIYCSVGHSLGAAMSVLISLELRLKNYSSWAFLLSPPKVGASDFNQLVRSSVPDIWRFIRINDFLPKLSPIPPYHHFGGKEVVIDQTSSVWPVLSAISIVSLFYFDSNIARFLFSFMLTLIGAQLTHATETYVQYVDKLQRLDFDEPSDYPHFTTVSTSAQWIPILVMVIFAYSRLWSKNLLKFIRRKYQKTILARLLKRAIRPSASNS